MERDSVLRQRNWSEAQLRAGNFRFYRRVRKLVMARELPANEAPLTIKTSWDTLVAEAGCMICFDPGKEMREDLYDYDHWPVRRDHFRDLYSPWDEPDLCPTPARQHLIDLGCSPHYNRGGVWARILSEDTWVESDESTEPVRIPAGARLCIASRGSAWGAPYSMAEEQFRARFETDPGETERN